MKLKATYTRRILAKMYFPDCEPQNAVRRLTSEIKRCVELYELLTAKGKRFDNKQILTIREVKLIEEYRKHPTPMTIQLHPQCLLGIQSILRI